MNIENFSKEATYEKKIEYFNHRLKLYEQLIGGWPTNLETPEQECEVKIEWEKDYSYAASLYQEYPANLNAKLILAELLRMGHNIDIPGAAKNSDLVLSEIFRIDEFNLKAIVCRASMYATLHPNSVPEAEKLFRLALDRSKNNVDPVIYQGLGFTCLHQQRASEAISFFEKYTELVPGDAKIADLCTKLKAGAIGNSIYVQCKYITSGNSINTQEKETRKSWWKFW